MFRGRSPKGGYRPPFEGRAPPPPRPFNATGYGDDRNRPIRPLYHPGHHDHGPPDPYHRPPPRRRYPSPGSGSHPGGVYWAGGVSRERSPSLRGTGPLDHNLVITVGNELTAPSGPTSSRLHERDYSEYDQSRSRSRPHSHSRERSPDRSRAKSQGRSKSQVRSKSRPRSQSRSPDRSVTKSRGRSRSHSPDQRHAKSRGRSRSRNRAKSRGRSRSRSSDQSHAKSRGRSASCHHSRSRSKSRSKSRGRSYSRAASCSRRYRSRSAISTSSSSSHSSENVNRKPGKEFEELDTARRRKELEEMLNLPTKSILKKRNDSEDSPSLRSAEGVEGSRMSHVADQLLQAVKGMEPHVVASMLSELRSDPHMARRTGLDGEIKEILNLLGLEGVGSRAQGTPVDDIDDEEKFLYGDAEEPRPQPSSEPVRHHELDLYGEVTEEALYGDYPQPVTISIPQPHLSVAPTGGEVDVRFTSRPSINQDHNFVVHVSNPPFPPGTEPLEESERQAVEEYEKIQDLLKTIGLDLGMNEISKMAARTKERLHGNKPPPTKTPTRRHYSSGSSDGSHRSRGHRRRSHSSSFSSSSSRSPSHEQGKHTGSWSSDDTCKRSPAPPKSHKDRDVKETKAERSDAAPLQQLPQDPNTLSAHLGAPIPTYPPPQVHSMMPPNYPPPGYGQYGNYLPYMHQQWPPMFPPPMTMPPQSSLDEFSSTQPYDYPPSDPGVKALGKSLVQDMEKGTWKVSSHNTKRLSEEQNNESQKLKVLEEREKLKQDREVRMKKKEYLMKELERLRKQQGELLRKKRREKDGHKDPLLQEIGCLQEEVMSQISNLRKEHEAAEKKRSEIDKVALILGLNPLDRPCRTSKLAEGQEDQQPQPSPPEKKKQVCQRSPEGRQTASSSSIKTSVAPPPRQSCEKLLVSAPPTPAPALAHLAPPPEPFEYYDAGNHWCKNCNVTSGSMFDFFTHLHSKLHRKTLDPYERPWASTPTKISKSTPSEEKLTKPAKGSEFLLPVRGFFCLLCEDFFGDAICAEEHVTTHNHNDKYKKQMYENPMYEQRRNLDRQAGLASDPSGKKRKHEDNEKGSRDKEEKSKHKKEKKEKKRGGDDEDKVKVMEEQGEKLKLSKKENDCNDEKSHDEGRPTHSKKDVRKDDKYHNSREEEDTGKYKREEEERYKYSREQESRNRYRRDEDDRYNERSKYGSRDNEDRYKCSKYPDSKSREQEDGKPNSEKQAFKKPEQERAAVKLEASKPEPPLKPYDLPKVFCGPSPAMRAKLRKQSQEAGKPATVAATTSFGRFTWKKKENVLAKEAQKAAAEFIKDDEEANAEKPVSAEDSFAKSMAVAKEIAQKLGGTQNMPPPWIPNLNNRGRGRGIRPNLPAPAAVTRKTAMMGKPAPLNTFLSIRPQNTSILGSPPKDLPTLHQVPEACCFPVPFQGPPKVFGARLKAAGSKPQPQTSGPGPLNAKTDPLIFGSAPPKDKAAPPGFIPVTFGVKPQPLNPKPVSPVLKSAEIDTQHVPSDPKPLPVKTTPAQSCVTTSAPPVVKPPQPAMIKIVSDVAAPGVPESEQTRTVFVKPPPFMKMGETAQKSEKHKSNLAAAKAKDLFDIFYSGTGHSGTLSITKTTTDTRADQSGADKSRLPAPQNTKPQQELVTQYPAVVCTTQQPGSNKALPGPKTVPEKDKKPPSPETQPETDKGPPSPKTQPETEKNPPGPKTQPEMDKSPPSPKTQPETEIQISSVWSMKSTPAESAPFERSSLTNQPILNPLGFSKALGGPQNLSSTSKSASQTNTELELATPSQSMLKQAPLAKTDPQSELNQDPEPQSHLEPHLDTAPVSDSKPGRKTRGKATSTKKSCPAPRLARQTRSQTRYQTRNHQQQQQQSQSETEPDLASGDADSAASDSKGLDTSDPGSGLQSMEEATSEGDPQTMEVTPETLGLPSDMTSLDFDYDFNFE